MPRSISSFAVFHPRRRSLLRGSLLVLGSCAAAVPLSGFPQSRATPLLVIPAIVALLGMLDTVRCMQPRWGFYHGGVILLVFMDMLVLCLIVFFLVLPYLI